MVRYLPTDRKTGRQWAFNLTCLISSIFGLCLGIPNSYTPFLVLTAFVGFGVGGNIPIDTTICLEFIPQDKRFLLALLSLFQPIGVVLCSAIAYGFIPKWSCKPDFSTANPLPSCRNVVSGVACCAKSQNMGYRYLLYTLGAITLTVFFVRFAVFNFQESPKFLVYRGQDDKAVEVLQNIAKTNKMQCGITLEMFEQLTREHVETSSDIAEGSKLETRTMKEKLMRELGRYKMLFSDFQMSRLTILIWLTYICDFWGFTVAGEFKPPSLPLQTPSNKITRHISPHNRRSKKRCSQCKPQRNIPLLHLYLPPRPHRRSPRRPLLPPPQHRPQIHNDALLGSNGRVHLHLLYRQFSRFKYRSERNGIFLPIHVQQRALRVDA